MSHETDGTVEGAAPPQADDVVRNSEVPKMPPAPDGFELDSRGLWTSMRKVCRVPLAWFNRAAYHQKGDEKLTEEQGDRLCIAAVAMHALLAHVPRECFRTHKGMAEAMEAVTNDAFRFADSMITKAKEPR
jgi:squalene cyclase